MSPPRQEVGGRGLESPRRTAGQKEPEPPRVSIMQILDFIQEGRHLLDLIHTDHRWTAVFGLQHLGECVGVTLQLQPGPAFLKIEDPCVCLSDALQQGGFSRLPRPEKQPYLVH